MTRALFVGLSTLDISHAVARYPGEDTKSRALDQFLGAGGPAANAAVACALVTGKQSTLITALGCHPLADLVRHDLTGHNVAVVDATPAGIDKPPISSAVVAMDAQTRTVVGLDATRIQAPCTVELTRYVEQASIVLVDGHHPDLAMGVARRAAEIGVPIVLDAGRWKPVHDRLLPLVDVAICSATFAPPGFDGDSSMLLDYVRSIGPTQAAVTRGPDPILYADRGRHGAVDVTPVTGADTLGAGDILHGAFCAYYSSRSDFVDALTHASAVATRSCRSFGTRNWVDTVDGLPRRHRD
ncbi:PfkB family carbohydrate kinase [Nocardia sp. CNY236]|uniref:PfkB family carbohydrate kinase n=1 Tax=Nocardia sp. CNY236 TaxID=1169152 RepID=UPI000404A866|nr:PfkB family carbohydrate kinase [Nocardia sp. CNY236]